MISSTNHDELQVKESEDEPIIKLKVIHNFSKVPDSAHMSSLITPRGLTPDRQWYLFLTRS